MSSSLTRTKDGVPGWNGDPSTWLEFKQAARLYVASTKIESRYTCGSKIAAELSGAAKTAIMGKKLHWLSEASGVETLLKHLQETIGEPAQGTSLWQGLKMLFELIGETMPSKREMEKPNTPYFMKINKRMNHHLRKKKKPTLKDGRNTKSPGTKKPRMKSKKHGFNFKEQRGLSVKPEPDSTKSRCPGSSTRPPIPSGQERASKTEAHHRQKVPASYAGNEGM